MLWDTISHPSQRLLLKNETKQQVLARMWGNRNTCALLGEYKTVRHCGRPFGTSSKTWTLNRHVVGQLLFCVYTQESRKQDSDTSTSTSVEALFPTAKSGHNRVFLNRWVDNHDMAYTYNWVLVSFKMDGNFDIFYNMDKPWGLYAWWNKPDTEDEYYMSPVTWSTESERIGRDRR